MATDSTTIVVEGILGTGREVMETWVVTSLKSDKWYFGVVFQGMIGLSPPRDTREDAEADQRKWEADLAAQEGTHSVQRIDMSNVGRRRRH